jgi:hypothetical protein
VTLTGGADTAVVSGNCYRYRYSISDKVGNTSTPSAATADAKIDTTVPVVTATAPTATGGAGNQHWAAGSKVLYFRPSGSGSFTLNATATDAASGIDRVTFPNLDPIPGWSGSTGGTDTSSPYSSPVAYAWTPGAALPSTVSIDATSGAGLPGSDLLSIVADSSGPTGQSATLSGGPWYTTASVPLTLSIGHDSQAGVDPTSGVVQRASATLTGGTCGTFGSWSAVTLIGGADTTVQSGNCYRFRSRSPTSSGTPRRRPPHRPTPRSTRPLRPSPRTPRRR